MDNNTTKALAICLALIAFGLMTSLMVVELNMPQAKAVPINKGTCTAVSHDAPINPGICLVKP